MVANADVYLVAPASANTIAKLAAGLADSMVTTSFLASTAPRLVAPAMNDRMYRDAATQANLATLRERGVVVIEPEEGALASRGELGLGRLPEPRALLDAIESALPGPSGPWDGLRVLVSAGGTREPIDPVRFIGNRSSGRMGIALAEQAARRGAQVTLVAANISLPAPAGVRRIDVETAAELAEALGHEFDSADVLVMAAAPADFRPRARGRGEDPPRGFGQAGARPRADRGHPRRPRRSAGAMARRSSASRPKPRVTWSAPARSSTARAPTRSSSTTSLARRSASSRDENEVVIVERGGEHQVPLASKEKIADAILDRVEAIRSSAGARGDRSQG